MGGEVSDGATQKLERQGLWLGDNPVLRGDDELKTSAWTLSYWEHVNTHTHTHTHTHRWVGSFTSVNGVMQVG